MPAGSAPARQGSKVFPSPLTGYPFPLAPPLAGGGCVVGVCPRPQLVKMVNVAPYCAHERRNLRELTGTMFTTFTRLLVSPRKPKPHDTLAPLVHPAGDPHPRVTARCNSVCQCSHIHGSTPLLERRM